MAVGRSRNSEDKNFGWKGLGVARIRSPEGCFGKSPEGKKERVRGEKGREGSFPTGRETGRAAAILPAIRLAFRKGANKNPKF